MTRRLALAAAGACAAVLLSGCGSDSGDDPPSSAVSSVPSAPAATSGATSSGGRGVAVGEPAPGTGALLDAGLRRGDLPASYRLTAASRTTVRSTPQDEVLARCAGAVAGARGRSVAVTSPVFGREDASVFSTTERYRRPADLQAAVRVLSSPKAETCFGTWFASRRAELTNASGTPRSSSVTVLPGRNDGPTNAVGTASASYTFAGSGGPYPVSVGVVYLTGGRGTALTRLVTVRFGDGPEGGELTDVLFAVARRTAALS